MRGPEIIYKIAFVGPVRSGKSVLVNKIAAWDNNVTEKHLANYKYTVGADFVEKRIDTDKGVVRLQMWDIAGTGIDDARMLQAYLTNAAVIVLCVDMNSKTALADLKKAKQACDRAIDAHKYNAVKKQQHYISPSFIVVATKFDLKPQDINLLQKWHNEVTQFMEEEQINNLHYMEVSAKDGTGVKELTDSLVNVVQRARFDDSIDVVDDDVDDDTDSNPSFEEEVLPVNEKKHNKSCLSPAMVFNGLAMLAGLVVGSLVAAAVSLMTANPIAAIAAGFAAGAATTGALMAMSCCFFGSKGREKNRDISTDLALSYSSTNSVVF